jgi:hypothetical protein
MINIAHLIFEEIDGDSRFSRTAQDRQQDEEFAVVNSYLSDASVEVLRFGKTRD